ncbi:hypothetical protein [Spiroplasma endosymbiont of Dactylopius coccus]
MFKRFQTGSNNNNAKIYSKEAFFNLLKLKQARINKLKVFV